MNEKLKNEFDAMFGRRFLQLTGNNKYIELRDRIIHWKIESIPMQAEVKPEIADIEIIDWHKRKFATADHWDVYRKLLEEVGELGEAIARETYGNIELEFGDVEICLIVLASKLRVYKKSAVAKSHAKNLEKVTLKK